MVLERTFDWFFVELEMVLGITVNSTKNILLSLLQRKPRGKS